MKTLRSLLFGCLAFCLGSASAFAAAAINQTVVTYTDPTGNLIPFAFGVDTNKVQQIRFPSTVTGPQQTEVLQNPAYSNYGYTGVYPTVQIGNILPAGSVAPALFTSFVPETTSFTVTTAQQGADFLVTTGGNPLSCTVPAASVGFYFFITQIDTHGSIIITGSGGGYPITTAVAIQGATALVWSDGTNWYMRTWADYWDSGGDYYITAGGNPSGSVGSVNLQVNSNAANPAVFITNLGTGGDPLIRSTSSGSDFTINISGSNGTLSAPAGSIGEYISNTTGLGSTALTSGSPSNIATISLTPGDWDIGGAAFVSPAGTTTNSQETGGLNTTSATMPSQNDGSSSYSLAALPASGGAGFTINPGGKRLIISVTTSVYLVVNCVFAVSTESAGGTVWARRRR
jgi:hypothetical protein